MAFRLQPAARSFLIGFGGAVVAGVLIAVGWHLWSDHAALHVIVEYLNVHAAKINELK